MRKPSKKLAKERAGIICPLLLKAYPDAECALHYKTPFSLLIAVILSAQTTDANVNKVTPVLFNKWPTPAALAQAPLPEVEEVLHPLGFFRSKAKSITQTAQAIVSEFGGEVPDTMEELQTLRGVGRKTANIVMNEAFGKAVGIAVDTHVFRLAHRFGISTAKTPDEVERDLCEAIPEDEWGPVNHTWIMHGRAICTAKKPKCTLCVLCEVCPSAFKIPDHE